MSTNDQIRNLQSLQETEANKHGEIDRQIKNLQDGLMHNVRENASYLALRGAGVQPPK